MLPRFACSSARSVSGRPWERRAINESESSLFKRLRRHFRSSPRPSLARRDGRGRFASRLDETEKRGKNEPFISRGETERFARHVLSHWNRYERRIRHFAGLFVFKGLAPFSFRRFRGMFVFNDLAPLPVSPRNSPLPGRAFAHRRSS